MARTLPTRVYQRAVRALARRDRLEMAAADALLETLSPTPQAAPTTPKPGTRRDTVGSKRPMTIRPTRIKPAAFRSVLCPVDFSEASRLALRYAASLCRRAHVPLTVFYANDPFLIAAAAAALHDRTLARRSQDELDRFVAATLPVRSRKSLVVKTLVATGRPTHTIANALARTKASLVVVGTHGLTGADKVLLGSTTLGLLEQSTVPVLAVPRPGGRRSAPPRPGWPGKWLAVALDLDGNLRLEIENAARLAEWFDSSLYLVHVVSKTTRPPWLEANVAAHDHARVEEARARLETLAAALRPSLKTKVVVRLGHPADEIAALTAAEPIGLVITTLRPKARWFGARRGSVSYHVLSHATTPVLALPPAGNAR